MSLRSSHAPSDLRRQDSVVFRDPPHISPVSIPVETSSSEAAAAVPLTPEKTPEADPGAPVRLEAEFHVPRPADLTPEAAPAERQEPCHAEVASPDESAGQAEQSRKRKARVLACPVCGRRRSRKRFSSVGGRRMTRCWRCDLLTIDPRGKQSPAAHSEHLSYSMKTFWFHLRSRLGELGHQGPLGYSGPEEYSAPVAEAARDLAFVVPLEELERYTGPGRCPAILLFHALECVPDPGNLLAQCRRMLAADGRLYVAVSDANSLQCVLRPSKWTGLQLRAQFCCYSPRALTRLLRAAGFRVARRMRSGMEVVGMRLEDALAAPRQEKPGFRGLLERWFPVIARLAKDILSCGSVLYFEAVPNKDV